MTEKLTVEKQEDGTYLRSDGVVLQPAEKNPFYVLATVHEEYEEGYDEQLAAKNRRIWNGWACSEMPEDARAKIAKKIGVEAAELDPLTPEELALVEAELAARIGPDAVIPDPGVVDFDKTHFSHTVVWEKCVFAGDAYFRTAHFAEAAYFNTAHFAGYAFFTTAHFAGDAHFLDGAFKGPTDFRKAEFQGRVPRFEQRDFHDATNFTQAAVGKDGTRYWPEVPQDKRVAEDDKGAYRRLRQISANQHNPEAEHFFLRQEMACDAVLKEDWLSRTVVRAFGWVSSYGYSVWRPIVGLLATIFVPWIFIHGRFSWEWAVLMGKCHENI